MNGKKAVVKSTLANLRAEPSPRAELVSQALLGYEVEVISTGKKWFRIKMDDGETGFIHQGSLISAEEGSYFLSLPKIMVSKVYPILVDLKGDLPIFRIIMGSLVGLVKKEKDGLVVALPSGQKGIIPEENEEVASPPEARSPSAENIISLAKKLIGIPYLWGGSSPLGFDCSGFIQFLFRLNGLLLPRNSRDQAASGRDIKGEISSLAPADLLFFYEEKERIGHVALSLGNGDIIHSSLSRGGVVQETLIPGKERFNEKLLHSFAWGRRIIP
jgi:hypothetical protein